MSRLMHFIGTPPGWSGTLHDAKERYRAKAYRERRLTIAPHLRKECPKSRVTIRLDADVVARLRADGSGWQTRANAALCEAVLGK